MHHMKFPPSTDLWVCEHGYSYPDICPECKEKRMEIKRAQRRKLFHALTGILESLNDAKRNYPEAYQEFINKVAIDLPDTLHEANLAQVENIDLLHEEEQ